MEIVKESPQEINKEIKIKKENYRAAFNQIINIKKSEALEVLSMKIQCDVY